MPTQNAKGPADNLSVTCVALLSKDRDTISRFLSVSVYNAEVQNEIKVVATHTENE